MFVSDAMPTKPLPDDLDAAPAFRYRKPVRGSLVWWLRCLGVVAFVVILLVNLPRSQEVRLSRIDLRWLGFCMALTILQLLLEAIVWQWLLWSQRIRHPYPKTLVAFLASQYLGLVTPGHVGEFLSAGYISMDTGITFGYALSSVVMKKVLGWLTIVGFGIWGLPLLAGVPFLRGVQRIIWTSVIILVVLSTGIAVWVVSFSAIALANGVGDRHPGQWLPFWERACGTERPWACAYLAQRESELCDAGSGWACNEYGLLQSEREIEGPGALPAFTRGCDIGFGAACLNASRVREGAARLVTTSPRLDDYAIVLRGSEGPIVNRATESLYDEACRQGWPDTCGRPTVAAAR